MDYELKFLITLAQTIAIETIGLGLLFLLNMKEGGNSEYQGGESSRTGK